MGDDASGDEISKHLTVGKQVMDEIRDDIASMQTEEEGLLRDRLEEINAIRARDHLTISITLVVALLTRLVAWFLFNRGVLQRIGYLVEHLRSLRAGRSSPWTPSGKSDAIGDLELEVARTNNSL